MRIDATIEVDYYPVMGSMPQWEMQHTKVEQGIDALASSKFLYLLDELFVCIRLFV